MLGGVDGKGKYRYISQVVLMIAMGEHIPGGEQGEGEQGRTEMKGGL